MWPDYKNTDAQKRRDEQLATIQSLTEERDVLRTQIQTVYEPQLLELEDECSALGAALEEREQVLIAAREYVYRMEHYAQDESRTYERPYLRRVAAIDITDAGHNVFRDVHFYPSTIHATEGPTGNPGSDYR